MLDLHALKFVVVKQLLFVRSWLSMDLRALIFIVVKQFFVVQPLLSISACYLHHCFKSRDLRLIVFVTATESRRCEDFTFLFIQSNRFTVALLFPYIRINPRFFLGNHISITVGGRFRVSNLMPPDVDFSVAEQQKIPVPAPSYLGSFIDTEHSDSHIPSTISAFPFLKLPIEIRCQIYEWVVGNRTLHIQYSLSKRGYVQCYICRARSSQFEIYDSCAKSTTFEDETGSTLSEEDLSMDYDKGCRCYRSKRPQHYIDSRLLGVSKEAAREGQRLFYSSNTWHFNQIGLFRAWLASNPPKNLALVHRLHLALHLDNDMPRSYSDLVIWKPVLSDQVISQLPNVRYLHLELTVHSFVLQPIGSNPLMKTLSRQETGTELEELFRPLQRLAKLRHCTVVMQEGSVYDGTMGWERTFSARKEALREWAEDVRGLILKR